MVADDRQLLVGIVYGWDYDGIWSSSIPQLSFLIKENVFGECFRTSSSSEDHPISPVPPEYEHPQTIPFNHYLGFSKPTK